MTGVAVGPLANLPTQCNSGNDITGLTINSPGVGYWATDTNTLYVCTAPNTWSAYYTPYVYPHPLVSAAATPTPTPTATPTPTPIPTPTPTPTPIPTPTPTVTPIPTPLVTITKTSDAVSVSAGSQIGFTLTLSNGSEGTATGLSVSDDLPAGNDINWMIDTANTDPGWSISGIPPNQSLVYSKTLAGNTS